MTQLVESNRTVTSGEAAELKKLAVKQIDTAMQTLCEQLRLRMVNTLTLASLAAEPLNLDAAVAEQREANRALEAKIAAKREEPPRTCITCHVSRPRVGYNKNEWKKADAGQGSCLECLEVVGKKVVVTEPSAGPKPDGDMVVALEEEREVLKKQVANLKMLARNSKHFAVAQSEYDETFLKEHVKAQLDASTAEIAKLRKEAADAKSMCSAQLELAGKLTRATKELTASHKLISAELEALRQENERLEEQLMSASQLVRDMSASKSGAAVLKARLIEAEERRRRDVAQLLRENESLRRLIEDERQKSVAGEAMQEMLDDVLANLEAERRDIRRRLALEHAAYRGVNASM